MSRRGEITQSIREHPAAATALAVALLGGAGLAVGATAQLIRRHKQSLAAMKAEEKATAQRILSEIGISHQGEEELLLTLREVLRNRNKMDPDSVREWLQRAKLAKARLADRKVTIPPPEKVAQTLIASRDNLTASINEALFVRNLAASLHTMDQDQADEVISFFGFNPDDAQYLLPVFDGFSHQMRLKLIDKVCEQISPWVAQRAGERQRSDIEKKQTNIIADKTSRSATFGDDFLVLAIRGGTVGGYIGYSVVNPVDANVVFSATRLSDLIQSNQESIAGKTVLFRPPVMGGNNKPDFLVKLYKGAVDFCRQQEVQSAILTTTGDEPLAIADFFSQASPVFSPNFYGDGQGAHVSYLDLNIHDPIQQ